ncbi:VrrA/YqfQ family protein [Caenibacillus caldisaponilyticus]|uniref:VrrA/YqfQ family protein n=1 Tax=Caenibacillus caldisaponilyticus TaxID=1674942 RepID=UPI0013013168|nr:VrrA/YqfQ family protein [Caenibacillus caldisaponilyticus]
MFPFRQATSNFAGGMNPGTFMGAGGAPQGMPSPFGMFGPPPGFPSAGTPSTGGGLSRLLGGLFNSGGSTTAATTPGIAGPFGFGGPAGGMGTFGGSGLTNALSGAGSAGGGGLSGLAGMFQNVQKAIGVAQQIMPMVQQFAPMVRNLPALINMVRTMRELNDTKDDEPADTEDKKNDRVQRNHRYPNGSRAQTSKEKRWRRRQRRKQSEKAKPDRRRRSQKSRKTPIANNRAFHGKTRLDSQRTFSKSKVGRFRNVKADVIRLIVRVRSLRVRAL